jgi:hypothetical protein
MALSVVIIDSSLELEIIEKKHPELKQAPLILLNDNFSIKELDSFESRTYNYFDVKLNENDNRNLSNELNYLIWNWFVNDDGKDLSKIDGCSLGAAFVGSLEVLFNSILRYIYGLRALLNKENAVYYSTTSEDIFVDVIVYLESQIGFSSHPINANTNKKKIKFGKKGLIIDSYKRDLMPYLYNFNLKSKLVSKFLRFSFLQRRKNKKRILLMPSGKMEDYLEYVHKSNNRFRKFNWILPLSKLSDLFSRDSNAPLFYHFAPVGTYKLSDLSPTIKVLKSNIRKCVKIIDSELFINVMNRHTFKYFVGAMNYYQNALKTFSTLKPDLAIFSTDNFENFILASQAAKKKGIATAIIPHGLYDGGFTEYKSGSYKVFDYGFAFGKMDVDNYKSCKMKTNKIKITSFPYFSRFFPISRYEKSVYKKALILSPENYCNSPAERLGSEYLYYQKMSSLLIELDIKIIGIKARYGFQFEQMGIENNSIEINKNNIPLLSGYSTFPESVKNCDLVIGPASTAIIEAGLLGKDYFIYQHSRFHDYTPSIHSGLLKYVNVAFNIDELKTNILNSNPYKPDCSVFDLIDLEGVKTREDLLRKFERGVEAAFALSTKETLSTKGSIA